MDRNDLGARIAQRRRALGMTQLELAEKLHITDRAVSRWERGIGSPDIALLEPLAEALKLSIDELMKGNTQPKTLSQPKPQPQLPLWKQRQMEEEKKREERLRETAPYLGNWLYILFWAVFPGILTGLLTADGMPRGLIIVGRILELLCCGAYCFILLKLSAANPSYRKAGIWYLATNIPLVLMEMARVFWPAQRLGMLWLMLPLSVMAIFSEYHEYMAHGHTAEELDPELSEKWDRLWNWNVGFLIGTIPGMLLSFVGIGLLILGVCVVGTVVVSIIKLVYLHRMAIGFQDYLDEV